MGFYEFSFYPDDPKEPRVQVSFTYPSELSAADLQSMCRVFGHALGFSETTLNEYLGEQVWE